MYYIRRIKQDDPAAKATQSSFVFNCRDTKNPLWIFPVQAPHEHALQRCEQRDVEQVEAAEELQP